MVSAEPEGLARLLRATLASMVMCRSSVPTSLRLAAGLEEEPRAFNQVALHKAAEVVQQGIVQVLEVQEGWFPSFTSLRATLYGLLTPPTAERGRTLPLVLEVVAEEAALAALLGRRERQAKEVMVVPESSGRSMESHIVAVAASIVGRSLARLVPVERVAVAAADTAVREARGELV